MVTFSSGLLIDQATRRDWVLRSCSVAIGMLAKKKMARGPLLREPPYSIKFLVNMFQSMDWITARPGLSIEGLWILSQPFRESKD